jgi:hypothetical protein
VVAEKGEGQLRKKRDAEKGPAAQSLYALSLNITGYFCCCPISRSAQLSILSSPSLPFVKSRAFSGQGIWFHGFFFFFFLCKSTGLVQGDSLLCIVEKDKDACYHMGMD